MAVYGRYRCRDILQTSYKNGVDKNKNKLIINNILSITIYISKIKTKILKTINKF